MKIEDNFLDQEEFNNLQSTLMGSDFPWFYNPGIVFTDDENKFQFIHIFYSTDKINSDCFEALLPIIKKINPRSLVRIKANCGPRTEKSILSGNHIDYDYEGCITSIFYLNTNNGFTQFKTGERVESVANRLVIFPAPTYHSGVSCTDEQVRVVINFNYF